MSSVVLQLTDFLRFIFINPSHILNYLNEYFRKNMDSMQYCEEIKDGFLFIFRDFEAFKQRAKPLDPATFGKVDAEISTEGNFFQSFFVVREHFPDQGINIEIKVVSGDPAQIIPLLYGFIESVHNHIKIRKTLENTIIFHIPTYDIIQLYSNSLLHRFYLKKTKEKKETKDIKDLNN